LFIKKNELGDQLGKLNQILDAQNNQLEKAIVDML